jgi:D-methionine transport system substrate-binding protein
MPFAIEEKEKDYEKERKSMKKKLLSGLLVSVLAAGLLAGCGSSSDSATADLTNPADTQQEDNADTADADAAEETPEVESKGTITVAASPTPHAEILAEAKKILAEQGWDLEVTEFEDYVQPNNVVESEEFDANYFQHIPYLNSFNEENGTHLVNAGGIHYEPFGIYPGTKSDLSELEDGDEIVVPNDTTNEARALLLLQDNGIITLKEDAGLNATTLDIVDNPHNVKIKELEAAQVARTVDDAAFVVLNGNYALAAGFSVAKDAVAYEQSDSEAAQTYVNVIAVKEGHENDEGIQALVAVLKSDEIKQFILDTYDGAVIPFED